LLKRGKTHGKAWQSPAREQPDESNAGGSVAAPIAGKVLNAYFAKHPPAPLATSTFTPPPIQQ
jgi:hypothetical protein